MFLRMLILITGMMLSHALYSGEAATVGTQTNPAGTVIFSENFDDEAAAGKRFIDGPFSFDNGFEGKAMLVECRKGSVYVHARIPVKNLGGCTVELSAMIRAVDISQKDKPSHSGLLLRLPWENADGKKDWPGRPLSDGSFGWKKYSVRVKLPENPKQILIQLGMEGVTGKVWYDNLTLTVVNTPDSTPVTDNVMENGTDGQAAGGILARLNLDGFKYLPDTVSSFVSEKISKAEFSLDPEADFPGGKGAIKAVIVSASERSDGADTQLWFAPKVSFKEGVKYRISFWTRATREVKAKAVFVISQAPWSGYSAPADVFFTIPSEWKKVSLNINCMASTDGKAVRAPDFFLGNVPAGTTVFFADLTVEALAASGIAAAGLLQTPGRNLIKDSSFETGLEWWAFTRSAYLPGNGAALSNLIYLPPVFDNKEKVHGEHSLRIDNPGADSWALTSGDIPLTPGETYTLSLWMKASRKATASVELINQLNRNFNVLGDKFTVDTEWRQYSTRVTIPVNRLWYYLQIGVAGSAAKGFDGSLWIDAVQISSSKNSEYRPADIEIGLEKELQRYYTISVNEPYPVRFLVRNNAAPRELKVEYQIIDDYFERRLTNGTTAITAAAGNSSSAPVNINPGRRGKFIFSWQGRDAKTGAILDNGSFEFAVIDSVKTTRPVKDFTVCGQWSVQANWYASNWATQQTWRLWGASAEDIFDFRAETGERWMRTWGGESGMLDWGRIEPRENEFEWSVSDLMVAELMKRGIRIMAVLGPSFSVDQNPAARYAYLPRWIQDRYGFRESKLTGKPRCYPGLSDWTKYVRACVERYKGRITHWEILNEPNMALTPQEYIAYLRSAYETIKSADPDAKVVGFCSTGDRGGDMAKFIKDCLDMGAAGCFDVVSFHPYASRQEASDYSAEKGIASVRQIMHDHGVGKLELWNTELFYLSPEARGGEYYSSFDLKGHEAARRFFIDLANGVAKSFCVVDDTYCQTIFAPKSWNDRSLKPAPSRLFVIYNTLATYFEGSSFVTDVTLPGENRLYLFERNGIPVAGMWNYGDNDRKQMIEFPGGTGKLIFRDIMGNRMEPESGKLPMEINPVYIMPDNISPGDFIALMKAARISNADTK